MIAKNEGETIFDALASTLPFVDEYVVGVDDLSTDNTLLEVKRFRDANLVQMQLYKFHWENDFSKARNESIAKATNDFVFILDGHEKVISGHEKLNKIKNNPKGFEVFAVEVQAVKPGYRTSFFQERMFLKTYQYHNKCHNVITFDAEKAAKLGGVTIEHNRSDVLTEQRKRQRAEMNIEPILERIKEGDRRAKAQLPQEYFSTKDWKAAIVALNDYLKEDMEDRERYQVLIKLSMAYYWDGQHDLCELSLLAANTCNADRRNAHLVFLGQLYSVTGKYEDAKRFFELALSVPKPDFFWFLYPDFYYERPKKLLRELNDNYFAQSNGQATA